MRRIPSSLIADAVCGLAIKANLNIREDILEGLKKAARVEKKALPGRVLDILLENAVIARKRRLPICQDTGMAVVFCEIGNGLRIDGDIDRAVNDGIRLGYEKGFLRKSVVDDPLLRENTKTNTPCVIHYSFRKGERLKLTVLPKGFGSENAGRAVMLRPTDGEEEIIDFVVEVVKEAGPGACPPFILGVGIGGTFDKAASLAKEATLRPINRPSTKSHLARLERKILSAVNKTGIGPAGLGGRVTSLGVNVLAFPTHIAGLPVCVNISCHALRSASKIL